MRTYIKIFCILFFILCHKTALSNILPTFGMSIKNITTSPGANLRDSIITFDIYCQHTNFGVSDPFEFGSAQFIIYYNKALRMYGDLIAVKTGSDLPVSLQATNLSVDTALGLIKSSPNIIYSTENYFIQNVFPGTKLLSLKFISSQHKWPTYNLNLRFKLTSPQRTLITYLQPYPPSVDSELFPNQVPVQLTDTINNVYSAETYFPPMGIALSKPINLTVVVEGIYDENLNHLNRSDSVTVYLRNAASPFQVVREAKGAIDPFTFSKIFNIQNFYSGTYYIVVYHPQSIETWSKSGGENIAFVFPPPIPYEYDFSTASSQAFGNNLKLKGTKFCIYSGDVDQNGSIDLTDVLLIYNDSQDFFFGNGHNTDLNGDNIVDLNDVTIAYNNSSNFVTRITP